MDSSLVSDENAARAWANFICRAGCVPQGRAVCLDPNRRALTLFRESNALDPGRGKLLNIALCEEQLGLFASAFKHLQEVQGQFPAEDDRVPVVKQHLDAVTPQVPYLKIQLAPWALPGTTVTLDGQALAPASLGVDMPIDPGNHVVTATAPGVTQRRYEITVTRAKHRTLDITPQIVMPVQSMPTPSVPAPKPPAPHTDEGTSGVIALVAGGASLVVGAGTGIAAMAKRASTVKHCPLGPASCPASVQPDIDTYNGLGAASTATFIVGGILAATGVILVVTSRRGANKPVAGGWIAPVLGPGVLGAQGRF